MEVGRFVKVKKPVVSNVVAEYIEATRGDNVLDVLIDVELKTTQEGSVGVNPEVAQFIDNCFEEFVIAREYDYIIE